MSKQCGDGFVLRFRHSNFSLHVPPRRAHARRSSTSTLSQSTWLFSRRTQEEDGVTADHSLSSAAVMRFIRKQWSCLSPAPCWREHCQGPRAAWRRAGSDASRLSRALPQQRRYWQYIYGINVEVREEEILVVL